MYIQFKDKQFVLKYINRYIGTYIYLDRYSFYEIISQTLPSDTVILLSLLSIGNKNFNRKYFTYVAQIFFYIFYEF